METTHKQLDGHDSEKQCTRALGSQNLWVKWLLVIIVLAIGGMLVNHFLAPLPPKKARNTKDPVRIVQIDKVQKVTLTPTVTVHGTVEANRTVNIQSQIRGEILQLGEYLIPGSIIKQGDLLVKVDDRDYQFALAEAKAQMARQRALYDIEQGRSQATTMELAISGHQLPNNEKGFSIAPATTCRG
ncbi:biotin/lipoyl-binding protein [Psychromonas sp. KJ10-10]|uniref:biotin/lipoyl-binding protein n=1 Tax=Psychromonas sp. KJ10-10 TaxID=3391823 RepID=UPI0039B48F51